LSDVTLGLRLTRSWVQFQLRFDELLDNSHENELMEKMTFINVSILGLSRHIMGR